MKDTKQSLVVRQADFNDVDAVHALFNSTINSLQQDPHEYEQVYSTSLQSFPELIEKSYLSLVIEDSMRNVVGFLVIDDTPCPMSASGEEVVSCNMWELWLQEKYGREATKDLHGGSLLWIRFFVAQPKLVNEVFAYSMESVFLRKYKLQHIALFVHGMCGKKNSVISQWRSIGKMRAMKVEERNIGSEEEEEEGAMMRFSFDSLPELSEVLFCHRNELLTSLKVRKALVEDFDDVQSLLHQEIKKIATRDCEEYLNDFIKKNHQELSQETYPQICQKIETHLKAWRQSNDGFFFGQINLENEYEVASLIEKQDENNFAIIAEKAAKVVGMMYASRQFDLNFLVSNFDLEAFDFLIKPEYMDSLRAKLVMAAEMNVASNSFSPLLSSPNQPILDQDFLANDQHLSLSSDEDYRHFKSLPYGYNIGDFLQMGLSSNWEEILAVFDDSKNYIDETESVPLSSFTQMVGSMRLSEDVVGYIDAGKVLKDALSALMSIGDTTAGESGERESLSGKKWGSYGDLIMGISYKERTRWGVRLRMHYAEVLKCFERFADEILEAERIASLNSALKNKKKKRVDVGEGEEDDDSDEDIFANVKMDFNYTREGKAGEKGGNGEKIEEVVIDKEKRDVPIPLLPFLSSLAGIKTREREVLSSPKDHFDAIKKECLSPLFVVSQEAEEGEKYFRLLNDQYELSQLLLCFLLWSGEQSIPTDITVKQLEKIIHSLLEAEDHFIALQYASENWIQYISKRYYNTVEVNLFFMEGAVSGQSVEMLSAMFGNFPDVDYLFLMRGANEPHHPLLDRMLLVPSLDVCRDWSLYVVYRHTLFTCPIVRLATVEDIPQIEALLTTVDEELETKALNDAANFFVETQQSKESEEESEESDGEEERLERKKKRKEGYEKLMWSLKFNESVKEGWLRHPMCVVEMEDSIVGLLSFQAMHKKELHKLLPYYNMNNVVDLALYYPKGIQGEKPGERGGRLERSDREKEELNVSLSLQEGERSAIYKLQTYVLNSSLQTDQDDVLRSAMRLMQCHLVISTVDTNGAHIPSCWSRFHTVLPKDLPRFKPVATGPPICQTFEAVQAALPHVCTHIEAINQNYIAEGERDRKHLSLSLVSKKMLSTKLRNIQSRVVLVGLSETGISALIHLLSHPVYRFQRLTIIDPSGDSLFSGGRDNGDSSLSAKTRLLGNILSRLLVGLRAKILPARVSNIDRKNKALILDDETLVEYDFLLLTTGEQDSSLREIGLASFGMKAPPAGLQKVNGAFSISDPFVAPQYLTREGVLIRSLIWNPLSFAVVYGRSVDAYAAIEGLLARKVPASKIFFVLPPRDTCEEAEERRGEERRGEERRGEEGEEDAEERDGEKAKEKGDVEKEFMKDLKCSNGNYPLFEDKDRIEQVLHEQIKQFGIKIFENFLLHSVSRSADDSIHCIELIDFTQSKTEAMVEWNNYCILQEQSEETRTQASNNKSLKRAMTHLSEERRGEERRDDRRGDRGESSIIPSGYRHPKTYSVQKKTEMEYSRLDPTHQRTVRILSCRVLLCGAKKNIDPSLFHAIVENDFVFDGRLVVNERFETNDPCVFAAGPLCQFSRKLRTVSRRPMRMDGYSGDETGEYLARSVIRRLSYLCGDVSPCLFADERLIKPSSLPYYPSLSPPFIKRLLLENSAPTKPLIPPFSQPRLLICKLPRNLNYISATLPKDDSSQDFEYIESDTLFLGKTPIVTYPSREEEEATETKRLFKAYQSPNREIARIRVNKKKLIESITYIGSSEINPQAIKALVGLPITLLMYPSNKLQEGTVDNLITLLNDEMFLLVFADSFRRFFSTLRDDILMDSGLRTRLRLGIKNSGKNVNIKNEAENLFQEKHVASIRNHLLSYVRKFSFDYPGKVYFLPEEWSGDMAGRKKTEGATLLGKE